MSWVAGSPVEARLPGLSEWSRVRDYRLQQLESLSNVEIYRESDLTAEDVLAIAPDHLAIATGARWRRDGFGRSHARGFESLDASEQVFTPDDIMEGRLPEGRVVIFDDDYYYMAVVLAERLRDEGRQVTLVTPEDRAASWGNYTAEQSRSQKRLLEMDVEIITAHSVDSYNGCEAGLSCGYTGRPRSIAADALLLVTARQPNDRLYRELEPLIAAGKAGSLQSIVRIGDCDAPAVIASAVYAGHSYARDFESLRQADAATVRDRILVPA